MIQAVKFAVHRFCELQSQTLESDLNVHQDSTERQLRTFRGYWRSRGKKYRPIQLGHIAPLSHYLLSNSFFSVGCLVFQQHRGASMGSQWAPIFCAAVALMSHGLFIIIFASFAPTWVSITDMWTNASSCTHIWTRWSLDMTCFGN